MDKELIKSELKSLNQAYGQSYEDIMTTLQELIYEENSRLKTNTYTIDLEGDIVFIGTPNECENFIKKSKITGKRNKKEYGLTTPKGNNIILYSSKEFSHLF